MMVVNLFNHRLGSWKFCVLADQYLDATLFGNGVSKYRLDTVYEVSTCVYRIPRKP